MQAIDASTEVTPKELAKSVSALWVRLMRGTTTGAFAVLEEYDLQTTHLKSMMALRNCEVELSVKELSANVGLSLPAISRTVDALLKRGFVERREDEHDRRIKRIELTPAGHAVLDRFDAARLDGLEGFAASLSPDQRSQLHAAIAALDLNTCKS